MNIRKTLVLSLSPLGLFFSAHLAFEPAIALANPPAVTTVPAVTASAEPTLEPALYYPRPDPLPFNANFTVYCSFTGHLNQENWSINVIPNTVPETVSICESMGGSASVDDYSDGSQPLPTSGSPIIVDVEDGLPVIVGSPQP